MSSSQRAGVVGPRARPLLRPLALALLLSCGGPPAAPAPDAPAPAAQPATSPAAPPAAAPAATPPAPPADAAVAPTASAPVAAAPALDAMCRQRVEGPEADGECTTDADCATGGCSGEVCAPAAAIGELMTTCEVQPCFELLDRCGCHDGRCTWTLKAAPAGG